MSKRAHGARWLVAVLAAAALAGCGTSGGSSTAAPPPPVATTGGGSCPPRITGVSGLDAGVTLPVIITGTCLGTHRPYQGWSPHLRLQDLTTPWSAGWQSPSGHRNSQGLTVTRWTNTQIMLAAPANLSWNAGDRVQVSIWPTSQAARPATYTASVGLGMAVALAPTAAGNQPGSGVPWFAVSASQGTQLRAAFRAALDAQHLATPQTQVGLAVYPTTPSSAQAIREMGTVFDVVATAPHLVAGLYELGASGLALGTLGELTRHSVPASGAFGALGTIAAQEVTAFYQNAGQAASQDAALWANVQCTAAAPQYVVASGQALVLTATNLARLPSGVLTLTAPLTVGQTYPGNKPSCGAAMVGDLAAQALSGNTPVFWRPHRPIPPTVTAVHYGPLASGEQVTITGSGFGSHAPYRGTGNHVRILDVTQGWDMGWNHWDQGATCWGSCSDWSAVNVSQWSSTRIVLHTYWVFPSGDHVHVFVWNANQTWTASWEAPAATYHFTASQAAPGPTITSIAPTSGPVGSTFTITGQNLSAATAVTVGGTPAPFRVSGGTLVVTVPNNPEAAQMQAAGTGGFQATVAVSGPCGTTTCSSSLYAAFTYAANGGG